MLKTCFLFKKVMGLFKEVHNSLEARRKAASIKKINYSTWLFILGHTPYFILIYDTVRKKVLSIKKKYWTGFL